MADAFFTRAPSTIVTIPLTGQLEFTIPFEFLARKFVVVTLLGTDRKVLTLNTDYRFIAVNKIRLERQPDGQYTRIELRRYTSATDRLVTFIDGSILRATDLNLSQVQTMHVAEEARDMTSDNIGVNDDGDLDARNRKIVNLADGENPLDAVNLGQLRQFDTSTGSNADKAARSAAEAKESEMNAAGSEARCVVAEAKAISSAGTAMTAAADANRSKVAASESATQAELSANRAESAAAPATEIYTRLNTLDTKTSSLETVTTSHTSKISALETVTTSHTSKISALEDKTSNNYTCIVAATGTGAVNETVSQNLPTAIGANQRIILQNPFGSAPVSVVAELKYENNWSDAGFVYKDGGGFGTKASFIQGVGICIQTGSVSIGARGNLSGSGLGPNADFSPTETRPVRVHVTRIDR